MSEILNFACPVNNCGRKFASKEKLDNHIKIRHNNPISSNAKLSGNKKDESKLAIKKPKQENKKIEIQKGKNDSQIPENKINNDKIKIKEEKKEKLEKEKNKIILDDLYSKINSLENYFENENLELQKQFELPEMPIIDNILLENEKIEQDENLNIKDKKENIENNNNIDINTNSNINKEDENKIIKNETENQIKEEIIKNKEINDNNNIVNDKKEKEKNKDENDLSEQQKNYDKDKIITITEDLIISNSDSKIEDLDDITTLNLSKKNIASFMNNRDVNFSDIPNLKKLNLSYNWMTYTYDIRLFTNLEELYLNDNKIDDISFCEFLPSLKILNCENNEITYITSLKKCHNLKILKLSLNKIQYLTSTLNIFKSLNLLEELTIKDNPFLSQIFAYKQYFLFEYQNLLKFDNEDINDIDRDIAGRFVRKNNSMYKNTPIYNTVLNDEEKEDDNGEKTTFRVGNTIITKEMVVPYKSKGRNNLNEENKYKIEKKNKNKEENIKNKELKEIIKSQKKEIDDIKLELENINQLNKEYEIIIENYKIKLEQNKNKKNKIINIDNKTDEKSKLLKELEMWKKEYLDLFNKINKTSLFPNSLTNDKNKNSKLDLISKDENKNIINTNVNLTKSMPNKEIKQLFQRPQTAQVRKTTPDNFESLYEGLKIMYSKNQLMDVVEEESDDEEEIEKNDTKDLNENKEDKEIKEDDDIDYDGNDIIPDDEIDELFRKSCADLQKMKDDIKFMNENIDKNGIHALNSNNLTIKGGKTKLNPVIVKKENNPNFIGNKNIFGNLNQKKI
jgi:U3 small nucleolar RNA-associated protein 14